jgi:very-short-patch-repair endonuclease
VKHALARRLRRNQTDFERKLWFALRGRRLSNLKFRRQQPIGPYIADFASFEAMLIVELDGSQHDRPDVRTRDEIRSAFLTGEGFRVLRFRNIAVIESFDGVLDAIHAAGASRMRNS